MYISTSTPTGTQGAMVVTDDSYDLALATKRDRIRRVKESKAAAAALNKNASEVCI